MSNAKQLDIKYLYEYKNDKGNRVEYCEEHDGFWWTTEYDSRGNEISIEDCCGKWLKREFDSNGHEIYYEDSRGVVIDNRPIVEIDGKKYKLIEVS